MLCKAKVSTFSRYFDEGISKAQIVEDWLTEFHKNCEDELLSEKSTMQSMEEWKIEHQLDSYSPKNNVKHWKSRIYFRANS